MATDIQTLFDDGIKSGLDKNAIIMSLVTQGGLDVTQAVREYGVLAKKAGITLTAGQRAEKVAEILADVDLTDSNVRGELVVRLADQFDVSEATAAADIRKYAEEHDIELPTQHRNSLEDMVAFVKDQLDAGKERSEVVDALQNEMGYSANSAASAFSRASKELGLSSGRSKGTTVPLSDLVAFIREHDGTIGRKALSEKIADELGYSQVTAYAFLTYVNMAKEWAKQELAEHGAKQKAAA
jgi:hypothetical protein